MKRTSPPPSPQRKKLKDHYDRQAAIQLAQRISKADPTFPRASFIKKASQGLESLEFFERQDQFAAALEGSFHSNYRKALEVFHQILGPELQTETGMFIHGWWLWPVSRYLERNAHLNLKELSLTLDFIEELTKRFTGEFAIRKVLEVQPQKVLRRILQWSKKPNVHIRRLASEGIRPRLPWASKSKVFLDHFESGSRVLTQLNEAPEKFVQKSVGNNLNDLYKEAPEKAQELIHQWVREKTNRALPRRSPVHQLALAAEKGSVISELLPPSTAWIIRHGQRSLRKRAQRAKALGEIPPKD